MRIYLDVCCYCRPFDDLFDDRIRLEAEAVSIILERCEQGIYDLVSSAIVEYEISRIPNYDKQQAVLKLSQINKELLKINKAIVNNAKEYEKSSITPFDALHLAFAEKGDINIFLTTDDKLMNKANKMKFGFKVLNPLRFIFKEL